MEKSCFGYEHGTQYNPEVGIKESSIGKGGTLEGCVTGEAEVQG